MGLFAKIKQGLTKTRNGVVKQIELMVNSFTRIDEELFEELEELLVLADTGAEAAVKICEKLRAKIKETGTSDPAEVKNLLKLIVADILGTESEPDISGTGSETAKPKIILVIGVNGVGKTTTIGKLAYSLKNEGKKVLIAAGDTFRAAAIEQLEVWSERAGAALIKHSEGSDPAAVVFDGISAAKARSADVLLCDTAGRLHNKQNLMNELNKIVRVIDREHPGSRETLLVLDATTGQNGVNQAREFKQTADISGIVLTKLDGTAKGGVVISIKEQLGVPVKYIGVGEQLDDLQTFDPVQFAEAMFE
ncbi:MAG: signal recognition particle-docking protein FtsY [Oscillospiraceae bacterium]|nr:signal recognition particle-docking protein FtsY [Oscillospiraceae bacterium]